MVHSPQGTPYIFFFRPYCIEYICPLNHFVTNMECRFPAMLVLWLGKEFYRGMHGNAGGMEPSIPYIDDKLEDHFGDEMWVLKSTGIFLISLLEAEIQIYPDDSM
ncbi:hypothetical protein AVEN_47861-1 [Araneus ventricosus]|uniref:Uncharacterized protein n=1 Tax=Araneus ventricosus TaxID=182803 RepID=A0A4Y2C1W0_ARAVE|nr:hypothetical protein AVEN_47861-1 [Araneus ventricosus]